MNIVTLAVALFALGPGADVAPSAGQASLRGLVVEALAAGRHVYVRLEASDGAPAWAVAPRSDVRVGDAVVVRDPVPVRDHESVALQRRFDVVHFAPEIAVERPAPGPERTGGVDGAGVPEIPSLSRPSGALTVAEIHDSASRLSGQSVTVRGVVIRSETDATGGRWLLVRDGSGAGGSADIAVATTGEANVGDVVLVTGTVATEHDLGNGSSFPLLVRDAVLRQGPTGPR